MITATKIRICPDEKQAEKRNQEREIEFETDFLPELKQAVDQARTILIDAGLHANQQF